MYAVVIGEAVMDLIESGPAEAPVFRPLVGGAPLNVAAGLARLGSAAQYAGAVSTDALGARILELLSRTGVGTRACIRVDRPTTLALTSLRDGVPEFTFYGDPPSFAAYGPEVVDVALVSGAAALYCGSIALMYAPSRQAAEAAWRLPGPLKILDPNVRPRLLRDRTELRRTVERLASSADVVKLSEPDAAVLFDLGPPAVAAHLRRLGARAVVVTLGAQGAYADTAAGTFTEPAPPVRVLDTTGAGDAFAAALIHRLMVDLWPADTASWRDTVRFATAAASLSCEVAGGATAMPALEAVERLASRSAG